MNAQPDTPLALGIVSDEIAPNFREAIRHGLEWGITRYEIRCLTSGRIPDVAKEEWDEVLRARDEHNLAITGLSPGIFKHPLTEGRELDREVQEVLPRVITMARECGAPLIIVFGFKRHPDDPPAHHDRAVDYLRRAAVRAATAGLTLAIENEPGFHCDTGVNTRRIIDEVGSPALGANWDPCNAYGTDETPYPDGYDALRPVIVNVHAKDTLKGSLIQCVPIGEGALNWQGQIDALIRDQVVRHVTIETHSLPLIAQSAKNVRVLRSMMLNRG